MPAPSSRRTVRAVRANADPQSEHFPAPVQGEHPARWLCSLRAGSRSPHQLGHAEGLREEGRLAKDGQAGALDGGGGQIEWSVIQMGVLEATVTRFTFTFGRRDASGARDAPSILRQAVRRVCTAGRTVHTPNPHEKQLNRARRTMRRCSCTPAASPRPRRRATRRRARGDGDRARRGDAAGPRVRAGRTGASAGAMGTGAGLEALGVAPQHAMLATMAARTAR